MTDILRMSNFLQDYADPADDDRAMTIPRRFSLKTSEVKTKIFKTFPFYLTDSAVALHYAYVPLVTVCLYSSKTIRISFHPPFYLPIILKMGLNFVIEIALKMN